MLGVDRTEEYLKQARKRAGDEHLKVDFERAAMRKFVRPGAFSVILNLFTSFGYFEDPREDERVLENMFTSLKAGGRFVLQLMSKEVLARIFRERDWYEGEGAIYLEERKIQKNWTWLESSSACWTTPWPNWHSTRARVERSTAIWSSILSADGRPRPPGR